MRHRDDSSDESLDLGGGTRPAYLWSFLPRYTKGRTTKSEDQKFKEAFAAKRRHQRRLEWAKRVTGAQDGGEDAVVAIHSPESDGKPQPSAASSAEPERGSEAGQPVPPSQAASAGLGLAKVAGRRTRRTSPQRAGLSSAAVGSSSSDSLNDWNGNCATS